MNTGIEALLAHIDRHREFLAVGGLLHNLRSQHQSAWVVRLLKEEFGSFGLELAGGCAVIGERLRDNPGSQFQEYERMRKNIISRFMCVEQTSSPTKKEHEYE